MSLVLAIHGNPGGPEDLGWLADRLEDTEVVAPALCWGSEGLEGLVAELDAIVRARAPEDLVLVGYSWGAWVALHYVRSGSREPDALVLVNPFLVAVEPLPTAVSTLATAPVLGEPLLALAAPRLSRSFLEDTFFPAEPPPEVAELRRERLRAPATWRAAIRRREGQREAPLPDLAGLPCPAVVLLGAQDRVASWPDQRRPLLGVIDRLEIHEIPAAGHALPWTHPDEIVAGIERTKEVRP
jgi:pimeloyl-ACP methyl ester carboxylesterase